MQQQQTCYNHFEAVALGVSGWPKSSASCWRLHEAFDLHHPGTPRAMCGPLCCHTLAVALVSTSD